MTAPAQLSPDHIAGVVEAAGRSVVRIEGRGPIGSSGIVWSAEDGTIVTANHALHRDESLTVTLPDGEAVTAELAGRDPGTDVAVLRVEGAKLTAPRWTDVAGTSRAGHPVLAL